MIFVHYSSKKLEKNKISFSSSKRNEAMNVEFKDNRIWLLSPFSGFLTPFVIYKLSKHPSAFLRVQTRTIAVGCCLQTQHQNQREKTSPLGWLWIQTSTLFLAPPPANPSWVSTVCFAVFLGTGASVPVLVANPRGEHEEEKLSRHGVSQGLSLRISDTYQNWLFMLNLESAACLPLPLALHPLLSCPCPAGESIYCLQQRLNFSWRLCCSEFHLAVSYSLTSVKSCGLGVAYVSRCTLMESESQFLPDPQS